MPPLDQLNKEAEQMEAIADNVVAELNDKQFEDFKKLEKNCDKRKDDIKVLDALRKIENHLLSVDKDIHVVAKKVQDGKEQNYKYDVHILTELHYIRKHQGKFIFFAFAVILFSGIGIGTQADYWLPYLNTILEILKFSAKA